jgi:ring-1,2-phenylacetyl-CoA epoxidase subunit PaaA
MDRYSAFAEHIARGGSVDATDWMPDEYRQVVLKTVSFQALAEVFGTVVFAEWLPKAPTIMNKLILAAKIQDEIGHGHVLIRVCEDLGLSRETIMEECFAGRRKVLSFFQYPVEDWQHFAVNCLMGTHAALVQFQSLSRGSYVPYNRALRKIMKEESFHYHRALDLVRMGVEHGTAEQRQLMQEGLNMWWYRNLGYFGPSDAKRPVSSSMQFRIKVDLNDDLRQRWLDRVVPQFTAFGFTIPDEDLRRDPESGRWIFTEPDWDEFRQVTMEGTPYGALLKQHVEHEFRKHAWVRTLQQPTGAVA